ncbi:MAG TPA: 50S ribosomal protein L18 [Clostridiales bacterium]|nr:50S ribosomal protein L18 [Clostridiales bacterium]
MLSKIDKNASRKKRHLRIRNKISGTAETPRLNIFKSSTHIYAQIIDDDKAVTLVSSSSQLKELAKELKGKNKVEQARVVGNDIAKKALEQKIDKVVFDRAGYVYAGRVAAFAEAAREAGLKF